jgi:hypothetical protein
VASRLRSRLATHIPQTRRWKYEWKEHKRQQNAKDNGKAYLYYLRSRAITGDAGKFSVTMLKFWPTLLRIRTSPINRTRNDRNDAWPGANVVGRLPLRSKLIGCLEVFFPRFREDKVEDGSSSLVKKGLHLQNLALVFAEFGRFQSSPSL